MVQQKRLPTQLHVGKRPLKYRFEQPRNYGSEARGGYMKPVGGMWTSTWETAFEDGWPWWVLAEDWRTSQLEEAWLLEPTECRVIELAGFAQVHDFMQHYGEELYPSPVSEIEWLVDGRAVRTGYNVCPVWERVAEDADAVRLLTPYDFDVRLGPYMAFYGWDCESTIWLRWKFEGAARRIDLSPYLRSAEEAGRFTS